MKKTCLMMYLLWIVYAQTFAQSNPAKMDTHTIKALKIGDKVPEMTFGLMNNAKPSIQLSELKGKLVILDFYSLSCSVCILVMPKVDSLQQAFRGRLQLIAVNHDDTPEKLTAAFNRLSNSSTSYWGAKKFNWNASDMLFAVNDKNAYKQFPHLTNPHYVWIGTDGMVKAITGHKEITAENISKVWKNEPIDFKQKVDIGDGESNITLLREGLNYKNIDAFKFFRKGEVANAGTGIQKYGLLKDTIIGVAIRNYPLLKIYSYLSRELYPQSFGNSKFIKLEVKDPSQLTNTNTDPTKKRAWEKENSYTYDMIAPQNERDSVFRQALNDINKYTAFHGELGRSKVKCYVLQRTDKNDKLRANPNRKPAVTYNQGKQFISNKPLVFLVDGLNRSGPGIIKYPVVDETGYKGNVDLELPADYSNFGALKSALNAMGLELAEAERELELFIIRDKAEIMADFSGTWTLYPAKTVPKERINNNPAALSVKVKQNKDGILFERNFGFNPAPVIEALSFDGKTSSSSYKAPGSDPVWQKKTQARWAPGKSRLILHSDYRTENKGVVQEFKREEHYWLSEDKNELIMERMTIFNGRKDIIKVFYSRKPV